VEFDAQEGFVTDRGNRSRGSDETRRAAAELRAVIGDVRRRWRLRRLVGGLAIAAGAGFLVFFVSAFGIDRLRFDPGVVALFRGLLWTVVAGLFAWFVARPLLKRVSDEQVALYLEEHEPSLRAAFVAAVEAERDGLEEGGLGGRLLQVAVRRARAVERGRRIERAEIRRSSAWLAAVTGVVAIALLFGPGFQFTAGSLLVRPWRTVDAANPYAIDVSPGDVLIARGSDQRILAAPRGFESSEVELAVRRGDADTWDRYPMSPTGEGEGFEIVLFDLDEAADYLVESEGVRSGAHRIDVADLPYVDRIDLEYDFPAWTGLAPRTIEDGGDVAAVRGTEVHLEITPTLPTPGARLVFDENPDGEDDPDAGASSAPAIPLGSTSAGGFTGSFTVDHATFYHIELEGPDGRYVIGSPDYLVDPLEDQPPDVRIVEPGRDRTASAIEEVFVEVEADDDYGLGAVDLFFSVNGGEERTVALHRTGRGGVTELSRGHTLFLEEYGLEPGDVIAYHARAVDLGASRERRSDIYFIEIRPFDRDYRQAEQGGGGPGGAGGLGGELSEQQRQIVAATFRLVRDVDEFDRAELSENVATVTLLQGRLRQQVAELVEQMRARGVAVDPTFRRVFEELPLADEAMSRAEERLGESDTEGALRPEQQALQHLLRAEAAFRDVQISFEQQQGGAGGGPSPEIDELADLFELEMDKLRNQYESLQRGERRQQDEQVDEALQKLEELARRQQQMNERAAARPTDAGGGGTGQQQLIEETEELARQLERLAREDDRPELRESARELREAADRMRRAQAGARGGEAGAEADRALDRLRDARRTLENRQTAAAERGVADALRRAERLLDRQRDVEADARAAAASGDGRRIERLRDRKDELAAEVEALETDLDRLSRESRREQPEAARALAGAADSIRSSRLEDMILYTKGLFGEWTPEAIEGFERQITARAEEVRDLVAAARDAFGESDPRRLERQLDEARDLVRGLESARERLRQRHEAGEPEAGQPGGGQPGQPGQVTGGEGGGAGFGASTGAGGRMTAEEIRQFQREFARRRDEAAGLREEMRQEGVDTQDLGAAISALDRLANLGAFDDVEQLERLQEQVLRGIKDFEFTLRRGLTPELERLLLQGSDRVPAEYRELVEAYYRSLSEGP
jgi:hypothetical protein